MAIFEASDDYNSLSMPAYEMPAYEIDWPELVEKIHHKLAKAQEQSYGISDFVIVVTTEQFKALEYLTKNYGHVPTHIAVPDYNPLRIIKAEKFLSRMKNKPVTGLAIFGRPVIGSDFVGELSPMIL